MYQNLFIAIHIYLPICPQNDTSRCDILSLSPISYLQYELLISSRLKPKVIPEQLLAVKIRRNELFM